MNTFSFLVHGYVFIYGIWTRFCPRYMNTFLFLVHGYVLSLIYEYFFISGTWIRSFLSLVHWYIPISST